MGIYKIHCKFGSVDYMLTGYLDLVLDVPSEMPDDERRLHHRCSDKVLVAVMLLLKLGQQCFISGMRKAEKTKESQAHASD